MPEKEKKPIKYKSKTLKKKNPDKIKKPEEFYFQKPLKTKFNKDKNDE